MRSRTRILMSLVCVGSVLAASCGEDGGPAGPGGPGPITIEPGRRVTKTLAADGGSITATAASGITYTLEVPAGALIAPTAITMTPVTNIADLGLSGGLAGAVLLEPAGLTFARSAALRIRSSRPAGAGHELAGFTASADFSARALSPAAAGNDEIAVLVPHFSLAGVGFGTTEEVSQFPILGSSTLENLLSQLLAIPTPWDDTGRARAEQIGHEAFQRVVLPSLRNAANDAELVNAVGAYDRWRYLLDVIASDGAPPIESLGGGAAHGNPAAFATEITQAGEEAATALLDAIQGNNAVCSRQASLTALSNVLFWQSQAAQFGVADPQHGLDLQSVLAGICAEVRLAAVNMPAQMQVGFPHSVDADFVIHFSDGTDLPTNFEVQLTGSGLEIQNPRGFTGDAQSGIGRYTSVITATATGALELRARTCLVLPGYSTASPLCGDFRIAGNATGDSPVGVDLTGRWVFRIAGRGETAAHCLSVGGFATIELTQNQNAITGRWEMPAFCGAGTATGTMSGTLSFNPDENRIEVVNWTVNLSSVGNQQVCVAFVPEIRSLEPAPLGLVNNEPQSFASSTAVGEVIGTDGCPQRLLFTMGMRKEGT